MTLRPGAETPRSGRSSIRCCPKPPEGGAQHSAYGRAARDEPRRMGMGASDGADGGAGEKNRELQEECS